MSDLKCSLSASRRKRFRRLHFTHAPALAVLIAGVAAGQSLKPMTVHPSPTHLVKLSKFDPARHPRPPIPTDESLAVLENTTDRAIVALAAVWTITRPGQKTKTNILISDSFSVPNARPVLAAHSTGFLGQRMVLPADLGGGGFQGGLPPRMDLDAEYSVALDAVVFEDGEIVGPDTSHLAIDLSGRKQAAAQVAHAIRDSQQHKHRLDAALAGLRTPPHELTVQTAMRFNQSNHFAGRALQLQDDPANLADFARYLEQMPEPVHVWRKEEGR